MNKRAYYTGFTLLELLVCVSVIGVLAMLSMAGFRAMQRSSEATKCLSNLRSISQGMLLFATDHDQTLPYSSSVTYGDIEGIWFDYRNLILPYLDLSEAQAERFFTCGVDDEFHPEYPSYVFNGGNEFHPEFKGLAGVRIPHLQHPAKTLLLIEGSMMFSKSWHYPRPEPNGDFRTYASFADGHVRRTTFHPASTILNAGVNPPPEYDYIFGD